MPGHRRRAKRRVDHLAGIAPYPVGSGPEGRARLDLAQRSCRVCTTFIADPDTVLLGVHS